MHSASSCFRARYGAGCKTAPPPPAPPEFIYVRARNFARPELQTLRAAGDEVGRAVDGTTALVQTPGAPLGPPVELILSERGLVKDAQGNLRLPEFPAEEPAVQVEPPAEPEPEPPAPLPEKKTKKKKGSRKHR